MILKFVKDCGRGLLLVIAALLLSINDGRADYIFASCQYIGMIFEFDPAGNRSDFLAVRNVGHLAFDTNGDAYVSLYMSYYFPQSNVVAKFDAFGQGTVFASGFRAPEGLAFDGTGNLYVADDTTVKKFAPDGSGWLFASGFNAAVSVAIDASNNVFVASYWDKNVQKFDPAGNRAVFASGLDSPDGLAFDHQGNLYVANQLNDTIQKFDSQGHGILFASSGVHQPVGLTVDSQDNLYVANAGIDTITKFDPSGQGTLFATLPFGAGVRSVVALPSGAPHECLMLCPTNMIVCADPHAGGATVEFDAEFRTNCLGFTITCEPPSGSFFPLGMHRVSCKMTDRAGNIVQTCTFNILVHYCRRGGRGGN